jgi:RNA polymerase sigma factor (sigma-70 family)
VAAVHPFAPPELAFDGGVAERASCSGPTEDDDEALVRAIQRGDPGRGRELYRRLLKVIDVTLCRVVGPGTPEHDDLLQNVFEQVIRTIRSGRFQGRCSLSSWAAAIACRVGLNAIRSRRTERAILDRSLAASDEVPAMAAHDPERVALARDELRRLRSELARMPEGRAEAWLLCDVLGYGLSEVAELTGASVAAVESRLVRGRRDLSGRIEAWRERSSP